MPRAALRRVGLAFLLSAAVSVAFPADLWARASGGYSRPSSGGYSRPSGSVRTPSFGGGGGWSSGARTPSASGGYARPRSGGSVWSGPSSPGDRAFSESGSASALRGFRAQQAPRPAAPAPAPTYRPRTYSTTPVPDRGTWSGAQGWAAPPRGYFGSGRSFGAWDGFFLGMLLSNLSRPGAADWFHNNQYDPGYQQWRAEADRQAQGNAALRERLADLDRQLAERKDQPRDPGAPPPDIPADVARADPDRTPSTGGGGGYVWIVVLLGGAAIAFLAWRRRRPIGGSAMTSSAGTPPSGSQGGGALQSGISMLRHKLSGEGYTPDKFRIGMTIPLDPTPFVLAGSAIKVPQPAGTGSGQITVAAIGQVQSGPAQLLRLYLADGRSLLQVHLGPQGDPDECRLFGLIDTVAPADPNEWGAWLDPREGMIGWPEFQTKDGKVYARVWNPGSGRIAPRVLSETIETPGGTRSVTSRAMLYGAQTGAAPPAPQYEYILVSAVEDGGAARVEIRAGIDVNPASLQLA